MDLQQMNDRLAEALNRWWDATVDYFSHLSRPEIYGWSAFGVGFVVCIVGVILL